MIAFVTLFLGLTAGVQLVGLAVPPDAARVELVLDGAVVEVLDREPWSAEVDLGRRLRPHRLEAVAFDAAGDVLGRDAQWINMPQPRHSGELLLERDASGRAVGARLLWQAVEHPRPERIVVRLDGEELRVADDRVRIPAHDPDAAHVLSAELEFPDGEIVRDHQLFGGAYGEETDTELTAVPLRVERSRDLRRARQAEGLLAVAGGPARVVALDRGEVDLLVVADRPAARQLELLQLAMARRAGGRLTSRPVWNEEGEAVTRTVTAGIDERHPVVHVGLRPGDRLFFVRPTVREVTSGSRPYDLFGVSQPLGHEDGGIPWLLTHRELYPDEPDRPQRIADAVASAAVHAVGGGRPRAVVLLVGPDGEDHSRFSPEAVRGYLAAVHVPLRVWYVETAFEEMTWYDKEAAEAAAEARRLAARAAGVELPTLEQRIARVEARWGLPVRAITTSSELIDAGVELRRELDDQRVVWVDGRWLPQEVELAEGKGVRFPE